MQLGYNILRCSISPHSRSFDSATTSIVYSTNSLLGLCFHSRSFVSSLLYFRLWFLASRFSALLFLRFFSDPSPSRSTSAMIHSLSTASRYLLIANVRTSVNFRSSRVPLRVLTVTRVYCFRFACAYTSVYQLPSSTLHLSRQTCSIFAVIFPSIFHTACALTLEHCVTDLYGPTIGIADPLYTKKIRRGAEKRLLPLSETIHNRIRHPYNARRGLYLLRR